MWSRNTFRSSTWYSSLVSQKLFGSFPSCRSASMSAFKYSSALDPCHRGTLVIMGGPRVIFSKVIKCILVHFCTLALSLEVKSHRSKVRCELRVILHSSECSTVCAKFIPCFPWSTHVWAVGGYQIIFECLLQMCLGSALFDQSSFGFFSFPYCLSNSASYLQSNTASWARCCLSNSACSSQIFSMSASRILLTLCAASSTRSLSAT